MLTQAGHLSYCTNIHPGESWPDHFAALEYNFPSIKAKVSANAPMGIGLRLSNQASIELIKKENLSHFKQWLKEAGAYVFTMNGFPYGGFHHKVVKDQVHTPDWTTPERTEYTMRLFHIFTALLPAGSEGGVSTSPLSYRHWFTSSQQLAMAREKTTQNITRVIEHLLEIHQSTGKLLHLDIEPEPDGLLETGDEFIEWFENDLLPSGIPVIRSKLNVSKQHAEDLIKQHLCLCYDICHFAIGFESHAAMLNKLQEHGIKVGKIQISAALKAKTDTSESNRIRLRQSFERFNEPTYLHQVVAKTSAGKLIRFPDLPEALNKMNDPLLVEWRAHFHVPIFAKQFDELSSTQDEITEVLSLQNTKPFTNHMEVETYTWEVLPADLKLPMQESVVRELQWVMETLNH